MRSAAPDPLDRCFNGLALISRSDRVPDNHRAADCIMDKRMGIDFPCLSAKFHDSFVSRSDFATVAGDERIALQRQRNEFMRAGATSWRRS